MEAKISIDRSQGEPVVVIAAQPGTDAASYEMAKPKILAVLEALGIAGVQFAALSEVEMHSHGPEQTLVVDTLRLRS